MDVQLYTFKRQDKARESTSIYKYYPSPPPRKKEEEEEDGAINVLWLDHF